MWYPIWYPKGDFDEKQNPNYLFNKQLGFLGCGPTWARTRDQLIMSQLL